MIIRAKVADTPFKLEQGLMFVKHLEPDEGMLFVFRQARRLGFWGKNTLLPLDIAFIDEEHKIIHIDKIEPHCLSQISCQKSCRLALEVLNGFFKNNGIEQGDSVEIDWGDRWRDDALITFHKVIDKNSEKHNERLAADIFGKPGQPVGVPIAEQPIELPEEPQDLPVVDVSSLGGILEDSYDEEEPQLDENGLPQEEQPSEVSEEQVEPHENEFPVFSTPFEATEWAEKNNEVVRINYTTKHGRSLVRDVEPHGKFHSESTSKEILVTYDETIGDIRAFIVSNIQSWAFVGKKFDRKFMVKA